ncbi:MAG: hypothetical protein JWO38_3007 [Gemmataceae bacterium]|nr:hypothetical protein [Gemmataceae bacterium]
MHRFAGEEERSAQVQESLADLFSLAESLYNAWLDLDRNRWFENIPNESANLALLLDVQACRLYRSVIETCQRCEAYCASILVRTLFETTLGVGFLLKKDVRIIVDPVLPKGAPPGTPPAKYAAKISSKAKNRTRKHLLSRELRANLYAAHGYFALEGRETDSLGKFPGSYHAARRLKKGFDPAIAAEYEKEIGIEWTYILRHDTGYSGLSVKDLARAIDKSFLRWYEAIYSSQSRAVHGTDFLRHLDSRDGTSLEGRALSSENEVRQSLWAATGLFLTHAHIVHGNIGLGTSADTVLHHLKEKFMGVAGSDAK